MQTVEIKCKGCWCIAALGISTREIEEFGLGKDGKTLVRITRLLPVHDLEVCGTCGRKFKFPPLEDKGYADLVRERQQTGKPLRVVRFIWTGEGCHIGEQAEENFLPVVNERAEENFICSRSKNSKH